MNKRIKSATLVNDVESIFKCPICGTSMNVFELKSFSCLNKHTFDFAKQGYINLTKHSSKNKYNKELFEARRKLLTEDRFFEPLSKQISNIIHEQVTGDEAISMIDMGCGEGSLLSSIHALVRSNHTQTVTGVGIDLAKEGIKIAAKNDDDIIWAVADLANSPFKDKQFSVILSILSPSNYREFSRLLGANGVVIKVVPQSFYLKELREAFFEKREKHRYSNDETVKRFKENFQVVGSSRLQYTVTLEKTSIRSLVQMTPLTWAMNEERLKSISEIDLPQITVDVDILIGKRSI